MQQADDFLQECKLLSELLSPLQDKDFEQVTLFKSWSVNDILVHLHFWNMIADKTLTAPEEFTQIYIQLDESIKKRDLRGFENAYISERGTELFSLWQAYSNDMCNRWREVDPKKRLKWVGPDMSARSSISARQMETWAHGQALFDLLGKQRVETDRIKNLVFLGVNAFGWSHQVQGLEIPSAIPKLELISPSGELWEFGEREAGLIEGSAVEFCQTVTQTRNYQDTSLKVQGEVAQLWMEKAQCFAGPREEPPKPGLRRRVESL